jgi:hypothetical protein
MQALERALTGGNGRDALPDDKYRETDSLKENLMLTAIDQIMSTIDKNISVSRALE